MRKIAICDSSCKMVEAICRMLAAQYGKELQLATYSSGEELLRAWQKDERKKAEIILMDVKAEGENGIIAAEQVREILSVLMSGKDTASARKGNLKRRI